MRLTAKLAFVHRALWQRDLGYRWAMLLGPPPLIGCALAALAIGVLRQGPALMPPMAGELPWAKWERPVPQGDEPYVATPAAQLPRTDTHGHLTGFQSGWLGDIEPLTVNAAMQANVIASVIGHFTLDQPDIPLARLVDAGPPTGMFVGTVKTYVVISKPGLYAFSVRLTRSSLQSANCLVRLGFGGRRLVRNINMNMTGPSVVNYKPTEFQLEPGLFLAGVAAGCWRGEQMVGVGEITLLIRHPGEFTLQSARADEVIRPVLKGN